MSERSYAILGTGALGGFYGARLQQAGLEVHFLLHRDYQHVRQHGLVVESTEGNFTLPQVHAYSDVQDMPRCDVVAVALKTTQNYLLPHLLPAVAKDGGVVLVLQNGLGVEEEVAQIVGSQRVIGGLCFVCANKIGPGRIRQWDYSSIFLAEYSPAYQPTEVTQRLRQIAADFERAAIPIEVGQDLLLARWRKLVWNIPFNGLSVVLNATTAELMANPDARSLVEELMDEVAIAAHRCVGEGSSTENRLITENFIQKLLEDTTRMQPYRTSMKIDYETGRPLEVEAIFGNPLRAAQQAGIDLPKIATLYRQLKFLDARQQIAGTSSHPSSSHSSV